MTHPTSRLSRPGQRTGLALAPLLGLLCTPILADSPQSIPWHTDFAVARAEAQARNRPVWIQFTGPWCPYCQRMERETFVDPEIVAQARDELVPVKLRGDVEESLAQSFGIETLPSAVILKPTGEVIARQEGFLDAREFHTFLSGALERQGRPARIATKGRAKTNGVDSQTARSSRAAEVGLAGYCPVTLLRSRRFQPGQERLAVRYDGMEYWFSGPDTRAEFLKEPETYLPVNRGRCVVSLVDRGESVAGDTRSGVLYHGRLYLCADAAARARFLKDPARYRDADLAEQGFCPHCRTERGLLVPGLPSYRTTRDGRRYLFPNAEHLAAFRASPDRFLK